MRFDLRPLRLTTGWSEPNAVVSQTLSVLMQVIGLLAAKIEHASLGFLTSNSSTRPIHLLFI